MILRITTFLSFLLLISCNAEDKYEDDPYILRYIFLGHIYEKNNVDRRIEKMNLNIYDMILLGGDVCSETTSSYSTLQYIDKIFNLGSLNTHWTLGNHDVRNGNLEWIKEFTKRDLYYSAKYNNLTIFNLNTSLNTLGAESTHLINKQFEYLKNFCDTLINTSFFIVIMHHIVWAPLDTSFKILEVANTNNNNWPAKIYPDATFTDSIYPMLKNVAERGIQVICVSGDAGKKSKKCYEFTTNENIVFLTAGVNDTKKKDLPDNVKYTPDKFIVFYNDTLNNRLWWEFKNLE